MKKRILTIALAMSMVAGTSMTALAGTHTGTDITTDGTSGNAAVEGEVTIDNKTDDTSSGNTDFYLTVDKDATSEEGPTTDEEDIVGSGDVIYVIDYTKTTKSNLSVTVPLYVCMYAYGGDGKVVVPTQNAYKMDNSSKHEESSKVTAIYPSYKVIALNNETAGLDELKKELDANKQVYNTTGAYGYYTVGEKESETYYAVEMTNCFEQAGDKYFKSGVTENTVTVDDKTYTVGEAHPDFTGSSKGQAVRVASIQATPAGAEWALMASGTALKAHEFTMTVKNLDLSTVTSLTDITNLAWDIAEPTVSNGTVTAPTSLSLPISAAIAGNSVNEDTHIGVVGVEYTIVPLA